MYEFRESIQTLEVLQYRKDGTPCGNSGADEGRGSAVRAPAEREVAPG